MKKYTMKSLPKDLQPRERLEMYGVEYLTNADLIAILISTGSKKYNALDLSQNIINDCKNGISDLSSYSVYDIMETEGLGFVKASKILAAIELGRRISVSKNNVRTKVSSPVLVANYIMDDMKNLEQEIFKIIFLNSKNEIIGTKDISKGTLNYTIIHPRDVFREAVKKNAFSIILSHNHPSGDIFPSEEDIKTTENLSETGKIIGIPVLDHIIIGNNNYYSFKENDRIVGK